MKHRDFTDFLADKHGQQYTGLDDEMPDDFERWLSELDISEVIAWADEYKKEKVSS